MSWERVKGHDALVEGFRRVVRRGRLAHAYLFTGPPGVGKRLFARELARALFCEQAAPGTLDACGRCPACHLVEAGTHPDLIEAACPEDKHEWPIELMREVLHGFTLKPSRHRGKIAILDDADDFNEESANCFLKTLEEPPPGSLLILLGTSAERQLPTILSRCHVVHFAPLPEPLVADLLRAGGVEDEALVGRLARLGGGSLGMAHALAEPELWAFRRDFLKGLTAVPVDALALSRAWMSFVEEAGKDSAVQRQRASLSVRLIVDFLGEVVRRQGGGQPRLDDPEERRALEALAARLDPETTLELLDRCLLADEHLDRRVQLVLVLEALTDALGRKLDA